MKEAATSAPGRHRGRGGAPVRESRRGRSDVWPLPRPEFSPGSVSRRLIGSSDPASAIREVSVPYSILRLDRFSDSEK